MARNIAEPICLQMAYDLTNGKAFQSSFGPVEREKKNTAHKFTV